MILDSINLNKIVILPFPVSLVFWKILVVAFHNRFMKRPFPQPIPKNDKNALQEANVVFDVQKRRMEKILEKNSDIFVLSTIIRYSLCYVLNCTTMLITTSEVSLMVTQIS